jgi:hypothetical protein
MVPCSGENPTLLTTAGIWMHLRWAAGHLFREDRDPGSMGVARHLRPAASHKKIEVGTLIGLHDVFYI